VGAAGPFSLIGGCLKDLQIAHVCNTRITRTLTNHSLDAGQKPVLISILGAAAYTNLLKIDPTPIVLEVNTIAAQAGSDFSFRPKYDLTVPRSLMEQTAAAWEGKPYTNGHTPEYAEWKPGKLGRIMKSEVRADGLWQWVYVLPSQDGYRVDVQAEGVVFPEKMVRAVSSEFLVAFGDNNEVVGITPILVAEVDSANVAGSGVQRVLNDDRSPTIKNSMEVVMELKPDEKRMLINSLTLDEVKGTNILQLLENDFRKRAPEEKEVRAAVLGNLTQDEKLAVLNGATEELVQKATAVITHATKIINAMDIQEKAKRKAFNDDVIRLFKNEGKLEIDEAAATHLISQNDWKPGDEAKVKKYIEFGNSFGEESKKFWEKVLNAKKTPATTPAEPVANEGPVSNEGGFMMFMRPEKKK
jgi:hypothetical protein